ncbi:MAG: dTDP-4-dehydrorhamnose 3,5-epimerase [Chlamydiota bacterium]
MPVIKHNIPEVQQYSLRKFSDHRGCFMESFPASWQEIFPPFVQDNFAVSQKDVLRGMHFQSPNPQAKLIWVSYGAIFDVAVDLRKGSSTFLEYVAFQLDDEDHNMLFIPEGFAHGYLVLSEKAHVHYKVSAPYQLEASCSFMYNDPDVGIKWPVDHPILSEKDAKAPTAQEALRLFS